MPPLNKYRCSHINDIKSDITAVLGNIRQVRNEGQDAIAALEKALDTLDSVEFLPDDADA